MMFHTRATIGCKGWIPGSPYDLSQCKPCHKRENPATVRHDRWQLIDPNAKQAADLTYTPAAISLPQVRPVCQHFGDYQSSCPCGDKMRDVHHCLNEATETTRCWRSALHPIDTDVQSCERCLKWAVKRLPLQDIADAIGVARIRAVVINLARRPDRWKLFSESCLVDDVERFEAIDCKVPTEPKPEWWRSGNGAWGCHLSHHAIMRQAIANGLHDGGALLVFEDDAIFSNDFIDAAIPFLASVPRQWDQIYLGGQHLSRTQVINDKVIRGYNVNRAHAYILNGPFIVTLHDHLTDCNKRQTHKQHVDYRMGMLHPTINCYCPRRWLVGQRGGVSDIGIYMKGVQFWY